MSVYLLLPKFDAISYLITTNFVYSMHQMKDLEDLFLEIQNLLQCLRPNSENGNSETGEGRGLGGGAPKRLPGVPYLGLNPSCLPCKSWKLVDLLPFCL